MSTKIYSAYTFSGDMPALFTLLKKLREERIASWMSKKLVGSQLLAYEAELRKVNRHNEDDEHAIVYIRQRDPKLLVQFFHADNRFYKRLRRDRRFKDFHYQDQTDWPDGMTKREWEHRRKVWDQVIGGEFSAPIDAGFSFTLFTLKYVILRTMIAQDEMARKKA